MRPWPAALAVIVLLVTAACSDDEAADPAPDRRSTTSTAVVDRSGIALLPVGGVTTTTVRETGSARLVGTVRGPAGPVAGATVRVERFVADGSRQTDVMTGEDGRFVLEGVPGGRYRVRAFQPPRLAQLEADVRFLADGAEHEFDLVLEEHTGLVVRSSAAPSPATVGFPVNLVVLVAERRVDEDGIVRVAPVAGARAELAGLSRWSLRFDGGGSSSSTATSTDGAGRARWALQCDAPGDPGLAVRIPVTVAAAPPAAGPPDPSAPPTTAAPTTRLETVALELAACVEAPSSTTTVDPGSTTTTTSADGDG